MEDPWLDFSYRATWATRWMASPPLSPLLFLVFYWRWGSCVSVSWHQTRTMSKYISPWHLSLLCSICPLMHWQQRSGEYQPGRATTGIKAAHCLSPTGATAVQVTQPAPTNISEMEQAALHRMAKSNCPADIVPIYRWRNWDCHQTFKEKVPETDLNNWPWQCNTETTSTYG